MGSGSNAMDDMIDVEDDDPGDPDPRIIFLYMYLNRSFKIKSDRWAKIVSTDETRVRSVILNGASRYLM